MIYPLIIAAMGAVITFLGISAIKLHFTLRATELKLSQSRELVFVFARKVLLEHTDGSKRAVRVIEDFCRYNPPDLVIAQALASVPTSGNEECNPE